MEVIKPTYEIMSEPNWDEVLTGLERAIRTCYKSEDAITPESADTLIRGIIKRGHESTLEHHSMTVRFVCDRGVTHEMVRHRHCSFSQESTRYVGYSPDCKNFAGEMQFILPCWLDGKLVGTWDVERWIHETNYYDECDMIYPAEYEWLLALLRSGQSYKTLIEKGWNPEHARSVLPNSLKSEIVVTTNIRDWRHIFSLRCDKTAHPQMRELMVPLWTELAGKCPTLFDSIIFDCQDWTTIQKRETKAK